MVTGRIVRNFLEAAAKDLPYSYLNIPSDICQELLPHILAYENILLRSGLAKDPLDAYRTCHTFAEFLDSCGGLNDVAQRLQEQAIQVLKGCSSDAADPDWAGMASSICLLARIYHHRGKHDEATLLLKEQLETQGVRDAFQAGSPNAIALAELLSSALCYQRKFDDAAACAADVLAVRKEHYPQDKRAILRYRTTLAWI